MWIRWIRFRNTGNYFLTYLLNIVFVLMQFLYIHSMAVFGFMTPPDSGEKLTLGETLFMH